MFSFENDGLATIGRVLDDAQLETARAEVARIEPGGVRGGYACIVHDSWRRSEPLAALARHLGVHACRALGVPALVLFHDHVLVKYPHGDDMTWHQDYSYLPLDRPDGVTFWVALDDVTTVNGCLFYLPGTHKQGERRAAWGMTGDDDPRAGLPPIDVREHELGIPGVAEAGTAIVHDTLLWHRSPRNVSDTPRRTWALSFVSPEARWSPRHSPHPRSAVTLKAEGEPLEDDLIRVSPPEAGPSSRPASS